MLFIKYALWAALAGGLIPVMAVLNAKLGATLGNPLHAPVILMLVGLLVAISISLILTSKLPNVRALGSVNPMYLLGGFFVCFYVVSATLLSPRIGVGNFILFAVCTQIVVSAAIDHFGLFGAAVREVSLARLGGLALVITGLITSQLAKN
ncbi:transporter family-2 protein [Jezberella montanilacus]|jgi:transporter family-2 protein|uniref:Transporter family-2 protein n=1 Tax=Jezberella montanilacus TaxID=323426 RepID=A0A2T0XL22_9BURK|nr:DMT family transporter [Jezberella montanilacus]PRY99600.1 transporter family-2 protein [Jezberella montanilacus]